eukprot:scaffold80_cov382-Prasinococcus_capsulatus_cf.AAC.13
MVRGRLADRYLLAGWRSRWGLLPDSVAISGPGHCARDLLRLWRLSSLASPALPAPRRSDIATRSSPLRVICVSTCDAGGSGPAALPANTTAAHSWLKHSFQALLDTARSTARGRHPPHRMVSTSEAAGQSSRRLAPARTIFDGLDQDEGARVVQAPAEGVLGGDPLQRVHGAGGQGVADRQDRPVSVGHAEAHEGRNAAAQQPRRLQGVERLDRRLVLAAALAAVCRCRAPQAELRGGALGLLLFRAAGLQARGAAALRGRRLRRGPLLAALRLRERRHRQQGRRLHPRRIVVVSIISSIIIIIIADGGGALRCAPRPRRTGRGASALLPGAARRRGPAAQRGEEHLLLPPQLRILRADVKIPGRRARRGQVQHARKTWTRGGRVHARARSAALGHCRRPPGLGACAASWRWPPHRSETSSEDDAPPAKPALSGRAAAGPRGHLCGRRWRGR